MAVEPRPFDQRWVDRLELAAEIRKLPPRQRAVVVLRYLDELSIAETAQTLGCAESTVRAHGARALARLRVTLTEASEPTPTSSHSPPRAMKGGHAH